MDRLKSVNREELGEVAFIGSHSFSEGEVILVQNLAFKANQ